MYSLVVDRIAITVVIPSPNLYKVVIAQFWGMSDIQADILPNGKMVVRDEEYCTHLYYYPEYESKKKRRCIASMTLGANKLFGGKSLHRYFTLTLYPSQFRGNEFDHFKTVLGQLLPDFSYENLYSNGKVNYLELASDTLSHKNHSFLPYRKYSVNSAIYKDGESLGTVYLGGVTSNLRFRIYDKKKQLEDKSIYCGSHANIRTRIEAVMRRLSVAPVDLLSIKNPFLKLKIADLNQAKAAYADKAWKCFLIDCTNGQGVPDALAKCSHYNRKKYRATFDDLQVWWWKPDFVWAQYPKALARISL